MELCGLLILCGKEDICRLYFMNNLYERISKTNMKKKNVFIAAFRKMEYEQ